MSKALTGMRPVNWHDWGAPTFGEVTQEQCSERIYEHRRKEVLSAGTPESSTSVELRDTAKKGQI